MMRPDYPLKALRELRDERAETQARAVAEQVSSTQAALSELSRREQLRRAQAADTADCLRLERERLAAGQVSGADLLRVVEFEAAARAQAQLLQRAEDEARQQLHAQRELLERLRQELAQREAEARLVRNHEAGFHERRQQAAARAEEEVALEQWNARHR